MKAPGPAMGRCWLDLSPPLSLPNRVCNESSANGLERQLTLAMSP